MDKRGVCLTEVLIAIILVAAMASYALPRYQWTIEKSRTQEAAAILSEVRKAYIAYYYEHGDYPAVLAGGGAPTTPEDWGMGISIPTSKFFGAPQIGLMDNNTQAGTRPIVTMGRSLLPKPGYIMAINLYGEIYCIGCNNNHTCGTGFEGQYACASMGMPQVPAARSWGN